MILNFGRVENLPEEEQERLNKLKRVFDLHRSANRKKRRYYEGKITLAEVNLGIALPTGIQKLQIGCAWGEKAVDVLAARSMLDGFVDPHGSDAEIMNNIADRNELLAEYKKACVEELKYGPAFAAVSGSKGAAKIRFFSVHNAAGLWDASNKCLECGFAFDDSRIEDDLEWGPEHVTYYTAKATWDLDRVGGTWTATEHPHNFGQPLLNVMVWNATSDKPFGQSRIKEPIRRLMQGYVRTVANATIGLEFSTTPQKYLLGISDEQYDAVINNKFKQYVGSIIAGTANQDTGNPPVFGQLPQGTIQPHVDMLRILSTQFAAASGLTVTDVGVVNDANPTSSDAILAQSQTLIALAEKLNAGNAGTLKKISRQALAIELGTTPDNLPPECKDTIAHFKNPSMPSVSTTADAAIKIASARKEFAKTDVFLEMLGFDQADIRRIKAQEQKEATNALLRAALMVEDEGNGDQ